jgi:ATP-dependent DNA helicase RecQ
MKDQVVNLLRKNIPALAIHSGLSTYEIDHILYNFNSSDTKFLFISPERLKSQKIIDYLQIWDISLLVIDEAHCISQWGYDFRTSYLQIQEAIPYIPDAKILALTASATKLVQQDIESKLAFTQSNTIANSIQRTNLTFVVQTVQHKLINTIQAIKQVDGSAIVYCKNRGTTIEVAEHLNKNYVTAAAYHAGMDIHTRNSIQDIWMNNKIQVIVCTNAFGMGIDKPNVRCVLHYDAPESMEAYYQEAGRAGRDGAESNAILLVTPTEWSNIDNRIAKAYPPIQFIKDVYQQLGNYLHVGYEEGEEEYYEFDIIQFCKTIQTDIVQTINAIKILEQQEFIKLTEGYYIPSRILCIADRDQMQYIETYHPNLDKVLKALLRLYAGILNNYINVQEIKIAEIAEVDIQLIKPYLQQLQSLGIIQYTPFKDKPQLQYVQERLREYDLHLDNKLINFLQDRYRTQLQTMAAYCTLNNTCRVTFINNYFDDANNKPCNKCDNCITTSNKQISKHTFTTTELRLKNYITNHTEINVQHIHEHFKHEQKTELNNILQHLIAQQHISIQPNGNIIWNQ